MINDPFISDKNWLAHLLAVPAVVIVLIVFILAAESGKPAYPATFTGELLSVREDALEIEGYGLVPLAPSCVGYIPFEGEEELSLTGLIPGSGNLEFVTEDDAISLIKETEAPGHLPVRVLITTGNFAGRFHEYIEFFSVDVIKVKCNDSEYEIPAGEIVRFSAGDEDLKEGRLILTPEGEAGITVTSFSRSDGNLPYPGRLEILDTEEGLVLINELDMETYLSRVVPSEMEGYFEPEALKAQAVCARTYACTQQRGNTYAAFGAQFDDSTNFQVYNNVREEPAATAAVRDTEGQVILYEGYPITAFYFSTSCGNTSDGSVWGMDADEAPYLKSVALQPDRRTFDWSDEDEFALFIKRTDVTAYDSGSAYFRWSMDTDSDILERSFTDIGTITDVAVTKRGAGGVALEMLITGTGGEELIEGQSAIRQALCDPALILKRNDGSEVDGYSSLPSAFLYVETAEKDETGATDFRIYGGGYGHGVGMSQNGAQGMAKDGMSYEEILKFFYDGVSLGSIE